MGYGRAPEDQPGRTGAGDPGPEEEDYRRLAEDWITIWQSEITAYLSDPETQQSWAALMALWGGAAQAMLRAVPPAPPPQHERTRPGHRDSAATRPPPGASASSGAAPAAAASDARDDEIRRLEQRIAQLEQRLDRGTPTEPGPRPARGNPRRKRPGG